MSIKIKRKEDEQKFGFNPKKFGTYSPKPVTKEDINSGLKKMFTDTGKQQNKGFKFGGEQKNKGFTFGGEQKNKNFSFGGPQKFDKQPQLSFKPEIKHEPEPEEDEPYWSGEEWEQWAYQIFTKYPDTQQFLPEWFVKAINESED